MFKRKRIAMLIAGGLLFAAQAGANPWYSAEAIWSDNFPPPEQITVFNPDGSAYSMVPIEISIELVALSDEDAIDLALMEDESSVEQVALSDEDAIDVALTEDDFSVEQVALSDDDADAASTYVAHFVSPPTYTGILEEEAIS